MANSWIEPYYPDINTNNLDLSFGFSSIQKFDSSI